MNLSKYTTILPVSELYHLIYNAKSDKYIICHKSAYTTHKQEIIPQTNRLAQQLVDIEAVIRPDIDEVSELKRLIESVDFNPTTYHLHINPTLNCNFRCWYCYEEHKQNSKMDKTTIDSIIKYSKKLTKSGSCLRNFIISFFGGEPLMYYNQIAGPIIKNIYQLCLESQIKFKVHFTTNGLLINQSILDSLEYINASFQITLDGGREYHNKVRFIHSGKGSYDIIMNNVYKLINYHHEVLLRINFTSENIDSIPEIINELRAIDEKTKKYLTIDFQRVWQDRPLITEDIIISKIATYSNELEKIGLKFSTSLAGPNHVRYSCYGDKKNHILINYDGNIFLCTARDFEEQNRFGFITKNGEIHWNEDKLNSYMNNKFTREICHNCKIAPLCGGGCRQRASESSDDTSCIYGYTHDDINDLIFKRFKMRFLK